ncbi:MAG TPA: hypothetical protein VE172_11315 [Stackebrandtia sp.]|uniref:hypothetical protein n=1 Tax=Stackebrandtia sp. TaxID=2023065 RepID=UPI002D5A1FE7|nr:hypothetical protein [Stackebrandtia sp.]HZE39388.1 hypothetical protein [Stackebrandtia sp.]
MVIASLAIPAIVDDNSSAEPSLRLVDDGGSTNNSPDPPYHPTPTPSKDSPSSSDKPSGGGHGSDHDKSGKSESTEPVMPLAAQAGLSVGVIGLAALALLPGRRPPAQLR